MKIIQDPTLLGATLLEVLISAFILAVGLLALANAQYLAMQNNQAAYWRTVAQNELDNILERLQVAHSTSARQDDIIRWQQDLRHFLPRGYGTVDKISSGYRAIIYWQGPRAMQHLSGEVAL